MLPRIIRLSSILAGLALATAADAQTAQSSFRKESGAVGKIHYDLTIGKITKLVHPRRIAVAGHGLGTGTRASVKGFRNTLTTGYFTTITPGSEFIDWATKNTGGSFMTAFTFGYGTTANTGAVSLNLSFYSGTSGTAGTCNLGAELLRTTFTGLPGVTASVPPGFGASYNVTASLNPGVYIPDGPIGWGYSGGAGVTGPRLTDFGTNTGWADAFQSWSRSPASSGTCVGLFFLGSCTTGNVPPPGTGGVPCSSFLLSITEYVPGIAAACSFRNAGSNPANLSLVNPPQIGGAFEVVTMSSVAGIAVTANPLPGFALSGVVNGTLLCDPSLIYGGILLITGGAFRFPVPKVPGLEGAGVCVQAAEFIGPGNFQLTNAYDCLIGG